MRSTKLVLTVFLLFIVSSSTAVAQVSFNTGIKAGLNVSSFSTDVDDAALESMTGITAGVFSELDLLGPVGGQIEVLFSQKGAKEKTSILGTDIESSFRINYVEIPVMAKFGVPVTPLVTFNVYGGPAFSFRLSETLKVDGEELELDEDVVEGSDTGLAFGGALNISAIAAGLVIDVRYTLGMSNIIKGAGPGDPETKNRTLSLTAALSL